MYGLRYQVVYGIQTGAFDVQGRAGYGLEPSPRLQPALPEPADDAPRHDELLYGLELGASVTSWGRLAMEVNGAHLVGMRGDLVTLAPGLRLRGGEEQRLELGLAGLLDLQRASGQGLSLAGAGAMASLRYTFL